MIPCRALSPTTASPPTGRGSPAAAGHAGDRQARPPARNVAFIANLMESGVEFTAVDMPYANKLTLHILSAVAEHKREMISARTKAALAAGARRDVGPTRPGDPAHARGPIGQPRRLARCRTQPGNRFGP